MISPAIDVREPFRELAAKPPRAILLRGGKGRLDAGLAMAFLEERNPEIGAVRDVELAVVAHDEGAPHVHADQSDVPGGYYLGVFISGAYCPDHSAADPAQADHDHAAAGDHDHGSPEGPGPGTDLIPPGCDAGCPLEQFIRILNASAAVID
jgi:hypothetical protein